METDRKEFVDGLRALADWYDAHPEVPAPSYPEFTDYSCEDTRESAATVLAALAPCEKEYNDSNFKLSRKFGRLKVRFVFLRDSVCVRKVVGTKEVPETVIPASEERVIPAHVEEIVEWECEPILSHKKPDTEAA